MKKRISILGPGCPNCRRLAEVVEGNSALKTLGFPEGNSAAAVNGCWQCHGSIIRFERDEDGEYEPLYRVVVDGVIRMAVDPAGDLDTGRAQDPASLPPGNPCQTTQYQNFSSGNRELDAEDDAQDAGEEK